MYKVILDSSKNLYAECNTILECQIAVRDYLKQKDFSCWSDGLVYENGVKVGRITYNYSYLKYKSINKRKIMADLINKRKEYELLGVEICDEDVNNVYRKLEKMSYKEAINNALREIKEILG